ncbi:hypothetical protein [Endozoicomonas sp. SCSIO W0465]|uniref:hypothetical protein n=1 Tax=Endozoicomonas sp. SCSIO W0465 TaxID=2918516 RepID=UPI002074D282|nr:hypothetical protein [Endozoicomonas sp. SCSIO W0465]USE34750.1 hypothetical protein MJO57_21850 [Endozoicomonas sp. SCSIO W0465]
MGTAALYNTLIATNHNPGPKPRFEENPLCEAVLQIVTGKKYLAQPDTVEPLAPSTLGGIPIFENPIINDNSEPDKPDSSPMETDSSDQEEYLRSDITVLEQATVDQANKAKTSSATPDISFVNHSAIISTLRALRGQEVTANFDFIHGNLSAGFASFAPKGSKLCIQISFKKDLTPQGIPAQMLQQQYEISGNLSFDDDAMVKRVTSIPAWCFVKESWQPASVNPIHLARGSIKISKKEPMRHHLINHPPLTKGQQEIYDTMTSLFNRQLNTDIVSLKNKPKPKTPLKGQTCFYLRTGQLLFISFKIHPAQIPLGIDSSVYLKYGKILGNLKYDPKWLFSQIVNNSTLLHPSRPGTLPYANKIFFPSSSISLYFQDRRAR